MVSELEIRKEQRTWLFALLEIKQANKEENEILDRLLASAKLRK